LKYNFVDFSVVITANSNNPSILNQDFLKSNNIISKSWETKGQQICSPPISQVEFKEGVRILSQLDKIIFFEIALNDWPDNVKVIKIAQKYIQTLPHVNYLAVGINLKNTYEFPNMTKARGFIVDKFIKNGPWLKKGKPPIRTGVNLQLPLSKNHMLNLSIQDIDKKDSKKGIVLVSYNFHSDITVKGQKQRINKIITTIKNWKKYYKTFEDIDRKYFKE